MAKNLESVLPHGDYGKMGNSPPPLGPMSSLISLFRQQYPQGSLCCDLLEIDRGLYIVQASVTIDGVVLATAMAAQAPLETAEDMAKERVLDTLNLSTELSVPSVPAVVEKIPVVPVAVAKKETKPAKQSSKAVIAQKKSPEPEPSVAVSVPQTSVTDKEEPVITIPETAVVAPPISFPPSPDPVPPVVETPLPLENVSFYSEEEPGYIHGVDSESTSNDQPRETNELPLPLVTDTAPLETAIAEPEIAPEPAAIANEEPMDFSEIIARSNLELKRLGWTSEQGRNYLLQTYGKRSRQLLSDEQLIEFLAYLEQQPTP